MLGPIVGIFGGAGPPVYRAMMSKIVSADDQGIYILLVASNGCASLGGGGVGVGVRGIVGWGHLAIFLFLSSTYRNLLVPQRLFIDLMGWNEA